MLVGAGLRRVRPSLRLAPAHSQAVSYEQFDERSHLDIRVLTLGCQERGGLQVEHDRHVSVTTRDSDVNSRSEVSDVYTYAGWHRHVCEPPQIDCGSTYPGHGDPCPCHPRHGTYMYHGRPDVRESLAECRGQHGGTSR